MLLRAIALLLLLPMMTSAITLEVVKLFQPVSLHGTDGVGDEEEGKEPIQAGVMSRPVVISGAIPEDLVKAIAMPHKIASNSPAYEVEDANLLNLCKVKLTVEMKGERLLVRLDVTDFMLPEDLDLTARQVLRLTIKSVRQTLKDYFKNGEEEEAVEVSIAVIGTNEGNESLKDLGVRFKAGE